MQSTSEEAPGLLAYVVHALGAHHSPDVFHVQHELCQAACAPTATKAQAANKALREARERLEQRQARRESVGDPLEKRGPGRPPNKPMRLEHAQQALDAASREHERLTPQREQVKQSLQAIGQASHVVDLARGVHRNGRRIAADIRTHIATRRSVAHQENLTQRCLDRINNTARVVPSMQTTIACVSGYVHKRVAQLDVAQSASYTMHARLMPSCYLERVAQSCTLSHGKPLWELAIRLRTPLFEARGALSQVHPKTQSTLRQQAQELAEVFQRSSSNVEGRNGYLSLRHHQLRGLEQPRKRACLTAVHNFFPTRLDGTTTAERFFGQKPRSMFAAILDAVDLPPASRNPQRRF